MILQRTVFGNATPAHWEVTKFKHVLRLKKGNLNTGMVEKNLLSLSYGRIVRRDIESSEGLVPESYEGYQIVEPGDIVLRLTDLQNDKKSLRQGLVTERGIITSAYDAVTCRKSDIPEYWYFFLYALDLCKYYYSLGSGVRQSISFADFPNDWIAVPPRVEQRSIADRIRAGIDESDSLIAMVGGNRAAQVALPNSLLHSLWVRKASTVLDEICGRNSEGSDLVAPSLLRESHK
jgi:restriction endonuclease S subunit